MYDKIEFIKKITGTLQENYDTISGHISVERIKDLVKAISKGVLYEFCVCYK